MSEQNMEVIEQPVAAPPIEIPACQKCGRQDETLRLVVFPFVFSLVVISFRRSFTGLWCKTHRAQYQTIAGLISSIFGWIGIPFGIIFTPITLFQLAKGGIQPADANIHILGTLAEHKFKKGDTSAAVRCLEESLKFRDEANVKARLEHIRPRYNAEMEPVGCLQIGLRLIAAIIISGLIGTGIGILDYSSRFFASYLFGQNQIPILVAVAVWTPLLAAVYFGGLALSGNIERTLVQIRANSPGLAISFAIIASLVVVYGIFEGFVIVDNMVAVATGQLESIGDIIMMSILTLVAGGLFGLMFVLQTLSSNGIYLIVVIIATIFFLAIGIWKARETIRWKQRISVRTNS